MQRNHKDFHTFWDIPGGRIGSRENIQDSIERELQEEIPNIQDIKVYSVIYSNISSIPDKDGLQTVLIYNLVDAVFPNNEVTLSSEHMGYEWLDINTIDSLNTDSKKGLYIFPFFKEGLKKLKFYF